jgi:1-aminocyclopropane-1-carboxylate deaminase/D-cysteine desulfhydrase-like pyridoxal-dependent ACC family enzyme
MLSKERRDELGVAISKLPRVRLASLPTPLQEAPRLSKVLGGPRIWFKRDDLTDLAFGGNKARMFEFELAEAIAQGADVIVSSSVAQSNLLRQLAAACAKLGLEAQFLVCKVRGDKDVALQGNLLLDLLLGANVRVVEGTFDELGQMRQALVKALEGEGRTVYSPYGRYIYLGAVGYVNCALELVSQLEAQRVSATHLYLASARVTQAGLLLGLSHLRAGISVTGFVPEHWREETPSVIAALANDAAEYLGVGTRIRPEQVNNTDAYTGQYAVPTAACMEAVKLVARTEGIILDPVYTGKAMAGLVDHVRQGKLTKDDTVVFLHTGGKPAVFVYHDEFGDLSQKLTK